MKKLLILVVYMSTEQLISALDLKSSSYSAIPHGDILETIQMRYAGSYSNPFPSCFEGGQLMHELCHTDAISLSQICS